jgi:energy-coupling factor transporter transmembrane protein EcfT
MFRLGQSGRVHEIVLRQDSPLRAFDPRTKLVISLSASIAVMTSLDRLVIYFCFYLLFTAWAHLIPEMVKQVWRLKWVLIIIFLVDWWIVSIELALIIVLRLTLLAGVFSLFFSTTTANELALALEHLRIPYRYAFSIKMAFQSVGLIQEEWNAIREAQFSRGLQVKFRGFRELFNKIGELVAFTVPAIVLTTRRAWALTEAAYARGFDSPKRISYYILKMQLKDWFLISFFILVDIFLFWR